VVQLPLKQQVEQVTTRPLLMKVCVRQDAYADVAIAASRIAAAIRFICSLLW